MSRLTLGDVVRVALIVGFFFIIAEVRRSSNFFDGVLRGDGSLALGYENNSIAIALREGRGYADPFGIGTGPTAWKEPAIPLAIASLYWLFNDDMGLVVQSVLFLQIIAIFFTGLLIAEVGRQLGRPLTAALCFAAVCVLDFHYLFQHTYDSWLFLSVVNLIWLLGTSRKKWVSLLASSRWGLLGGFAALVGPVCLVAWGCTTIWICVETWKSDKRLVPLWCKLAIVVCMAALIVLPWVARNRIVLGKWLPIKSNLPYEFWQSQCIGTDGLIDLAMQAKHPFSSDGPQRADYISLGEIEFVAKYGQLAWTAMKKHPYDYCVRATNRLLSATIIYTPHHREVVRLPLGLMASVLLPLFSLSVLSIVFRRNSSSERLLFFIYVAALSPYILISYYERYATPLAGLKAIAMLYFFVHLLSPRCQTQ